MKCIFFHDFSGCDLVLRNCPRGHAQKPPRDMPSRGISAKLLVAAGRNETKRAIVVLLVMLEIRILTKMHDPYSGALLSSNYSMGVHDI